MARPVREDAAAPERRVSVVGCAIDALTFAETIQEVDRLARAGRPVQHCAVNASKALLMDRDPRLRQIVNSCALVNADGQSIVWASRLLERPVPGRVAGVDLFEALLGLAEARGYGVYFLGARTPVVEAVVLRAKRDHPRLVVSGWRDGYWSEGETTAVVEGVRASEATLLFVGMPSPRKEYWLAGHLEQLSVPFSMGVGGSFDVYAGVIKRAPNWMQRMGLEWVFRLAQEPMRLWRRYLVGNLRFLLLVLRYARAQRAVGRGTARGGRR
jgi:N-acetylglucosaminyldiphosphoundecaprenol N-acetyl-beta-D-mannosaminyltransferase